MGADVLAIGFAGIGEHGEMGRGWARMGVEAVSAPIREYLWAEGDRTRIHADWAGGRGCGEGCIRGYWW